MNKQLSAGFSRAGGALWSRSERGLQCPDASGPDLTNVTRHCRQDCTLVSRRCLLCRRRFPGGPHNSQRIGQCFRTQRESPQDPESEPRTNSNCFPAPARNSPAGRNREGDERNYPGAGTIEAITRRSQQHTKNIGNFAASSVASNRATRAAPTIKQLGLGRGRALTWAVRHACAALRGPVPETGPAHECRSLTGADWLATGRGAPRPGIRVKYVNPAAETLLAASRQSILDQPFPGAFADSSP